MTLSSRVDNPNVKVAKLTKANFILEVYPTWLDNIVPVEKKEWLALDMCGLQGFNNACPKDDFSLPITEVLVDATTGPDALSFTDGF